MTKREISKIINNIKEFYASGKSRDISFRIQQLKKLKNTIISNEDLIIDALARDMKKPAFEAYASEIGFLYPEINFAINNIKGWSKKKSAGSSILNFYSRSTIYHEPYGAALIIGPWNYPFQLVMAPLLSAMAAGNCAVIKPSELSPNTSKIIGKIIKENFDSNYITVIEGGVQTTKYILENRFDYIFFTGGTAVGKIIMTAAAKFLTPVTLELGGKSPVIVDKDADIKTAARRIAWGKYFNAGQTCLAPDYLLAHSEIIEELIEMIIKTVRDFYGEDPSISPDYARIINKKHFNRITGLMKEGKILMGGDSDPGNNYIAPTIIGDVTTRNAVMKEEIFGPILPVIDFEKINQAIEIIRENPHPLALYLFTKDRKTRKKIISGIRFGGGCINDTVSHIVSHDLPFGGIGSSGMGNYHGKFGFETFSHKKSILNKSALFDIPFRYPPYNNVLLSFIRRAMRLLR